MPLVLVHSIIIIIIYNDGHVVVPWWPRAGLDCRLQARGGASRDQCEAPRDPWEASSLPSEEGSETSRTHTC